jgi:hypothetical protein
MKKGGQVEPTIIQEEQNSYLEGDEVSRPSVMPAKGLMMLFNDEASAEKPNRIIVTEETVTDTSNP